MALHLLLISESLGLFQGGIDRLVVIAVPKLIPLKEHCCQFLIHKWSLSFRLDHSNS